MPKPVYKFLASLAILVSATFVFYLADNLAGLLSRAFLPDLIFDFVLVRTLLKSLVYFPANQIGAILMTFAFWVKVGELPRNQDGSLSGSGVLMQILTPVLLGVVLFTLAQTVFLPELGRIEQDLETRSQLGLRLLQKATELDQSIQERTASGDDPLRPSSVDFYIIEGTVNENEVDRITEDMRELSFTLSQLVSIVPGNSQWALWNQKSEERLQERYFLADLRLRSSLPPNYRPLNKTEAQVLELAREAMANEDYFAANELAFTVSWSTFLRPPGNNQDRRDIQRNAAQLMEESRDRIRALNLTREMQENRNTFYTTNQNLNWLESGEIRNAYYGFVELAIRRPQDPEIARYLRETKQAMDQQVIFLEEVIRHFSLQVGENDMRPEDSRVVFKLREDSESRAFVSFEGMVSVFDGVYFRDVEILGLDSQGNEEFHIFAPYARYQDGRMQMETRETQERNQKFLPRTLMGNVTRVMSPEEYPFQGRYEIEIPYSPATLMFLSEKGRYQPSIQALFRNTLALEEMGHSATAYQVAFMEKIFNPFLLLGVTYLTIFLARKLRSKYLGYPPNHLVASLVFLPVILHYIWSIFVWGLKVISAYMVQIMGLWLAIPALFLIILVTMGLFIYQAYAVFLDRKKKAP